MDTSNFPDKRRSCYHIVIQRVKEDSNYVSVSSRENGNDNFLK